MQWEFKDLLPWDWLSPIENVTSKLSIRCCFYIKIEIFSHDVIQTSVVVESLCSFMVNDIYYRVLMSILKGITCYFLFIVKQACRYHHRSVIMLTAFKTLAGRSFNWTKYSFIIMGLQINLAIIMFHIHTSLH